MDNRTAHNMEEGFALFEGRPREELCSDVARPVYDFLDRLDVDYKTLTHPAAFTIEECRKVRDRVDVPVFKNLFLTNKQQTRFYLLLLPGEKVFKTKYLSAQIGSARLSFADEVHMRRYLGVTPGSVTPMGLIYDAGREVSLLIDRDLETCEAFACHPCINTASVILRFEDLVGKIIPATGHEITWVTLPEE